MSKKALAELFQKWINRSRRGTAVSTRTRQPALGLETVEDRLAPATLSALTVGAPTELLTPTLPSGLPEGGYDLQSAADPSNPLHIVAFAASHDPTANEGVLQGEFSLDGGASWSAFTTGTDTDPTTNSPYAYISDVSVAVGPDGNAFVGFIETNSNSAGTVPTSGAVAVISFSFDIAAQSYVVLDSNVELYKWVNQDPAYNVAVGVDDNQATNPGTGKANPTDSMLGTTPSASTKTVYVAWNTDATKPDPRVIANAYWNPYTILTAASGDEGATFTSPVIVPQGGYVGTSASAPQILFTPNSTNALTNGPAEAGTANSSPGSLSFFWATPNKTAISQSNSLPDGGDPSQAAAQSSDFEGAGGAISQGIPPPTAPTPYKAFPELPASEPAQGNLYPQVTDSAVGPDRNFQFSVVNQKLANGQSSPTGTIADAFGTEITIDFPAGFNIVSSLMPNGWSTLTPVLPPTNPAAGPPYNNPAIDAIEEFTSTYQIHGSIPAGTSLNPINIAGTFSGIAPYYFLVTAYITSPYTNPLNQVDQDLYLNGSPPPTTPVTSAFPIDVSIPSNINPNDIVTDLTASVAIIHPFVQDISIELESPTGQTITLLDNNVNGAGQAAPNPAPGLTFGLPGVANLGQVNNMLPGDTLDGTGLTFDDNAPRLINDINDTAPYIGHYQPEGGSLSTLYSGLTATTADGGWQLLITDFQNHGTTPPPTQYLSNWDLHFTFDIQNNKISGFDSPTNSATGVRINGSQNGAALVPTAAVGSIAIATVTAGFSQTSPLPAAPLSPPPLSPVFGINPGVVVAADNGQGATDPYAGRIYMVWTGLDLLDPYPVIQGKKVENTDIFLAYSDDGGQTWQGTFDTTLGAYVPIQVNQDSLSDNVTEGERDQIEPSVAVDPVTGTVIVTWLDASNDASDTRAAVYIATSIDGGQTFSASSFLNSPQQAVNALDPSQSITLEPIPSTLIGAGAPDGTNYQLGTHQSVVVSDGRIITTWTGNYPYTEVNGVVSSSDNTGSDLYSNVITLPSGPRVVSGDSGPVTAQSTITDAFGNPSTAINPTTKKVYTTYNDTFAANGARQLTGFEVYFDRPIVDTSFTSSQIDVQYTDPTTQISTQISVGNPIPIVAAGLEVPISGTAAVNATSVDITFPYAPTSFNASDIVSVTDDQGNTYAGPFSVTQLSPTKFQISGFSASPTAVPYNFLVTVDNNAGFYTATDGSDDVFNFPAGTASAFFIPFTTPQSAVGTYSYSVGPVAGTGTGNSTGLNDGINAGLPTWAATNVPITIPPFNLANANPTTVSSNLTISGVASTTTLGDVGVQLSIQALADLEGNSLQDQNLTISLTFTPSKAGVNPVTVQLFKNEPSFFTPIQQGFYLTTFDDNAANGSIANLFDTPPYTGVYQPDSFAGTGTALDKLDNLSPNGTWTLSITNNGGESALLTNWALVLTDSTGNPILKPSLGNLQDQNGDGVAGEYNVPTASVPKPVEEDTFTNPNSTSGVPFSQPYATNTLPLIIAGPTVANTSIVITPVSGQTATTSSQPISISTLTPVAGSNNVIVTLNRTVDPTSFTDSAVTEAFSPYGAVSVTNVTPLYSVLTLSLAAGQESVDVKFTTPPGVFTNADIVSLTGPAGNIDPGTLVVTPTTDPTVYDIAFSSDGIPAPLAAGGQYIFTFNSTFFVSNPGMTEGTATPNYLITINDPIISGASPTLSVGTTSYTITFNTPPVRFGADDITTVTNPKGVPFIGPFHVTPVSPTQYTITFPAVTVPGQYIFTFDSAEQTLPADSTGATISFATPPANPLSAANIANVSGPNGAVAGPFTVTPISATSYRINFPSAQTAAGLYVFTFNSAITTTLSPGATSYTVTFTNPPAQLTASDITTVTDPNGNPVPGPFTVSRISATQYTINFPALTTAMGLYTFTFDSAPMKVAAGASNGTVTFANLPVYPINANQIASITGPNGPVAGPYTITPDITDPTGHRYIIGFPSPVTTAGTYNVTFFPTTTGTVAPATTYADLTFATPPTSFSADDIRLVTDTFGNAISGPFTVLPLSTTVFRVEGLPENDFSTALVTYVFTLDTQLPPVTNSYSLTLSPTIRPADGEALNGTVSAIDVTFDQDMSAASFTSANVLSIIGPAGAIPLTDANGNSTVTVTTVPANATGPVRTFQVSFVAADAKGNYDAPQTVSGNYSLQIGPNPNQPDTKLASIRSADLPQLSAVLAAGSTSVEVEFVSVTGTLTSSDIASVTGPNALVVSGPFTLTHVTGAASNIYEVGFPALTVTGPYVIKFTAASGLQVLGLEVDTDQNAGVAELRGIDPTAPVVTSTYTSTSNPTYASGLQIPTETSTTQSGKTAVVPGEVDLPITVPDDFVVDEGTSPSQQIQLLMNIDFAYDPYLDIDLVAPDGTSVRVFTGSDQTGKTNQENFTNTLLEDSSVTANGTTISPITSALPPYNPGAGAFNPQFPLSTFNGTAAQGTWFLRIFNNSNLPGGVVLNATLTLPHTTLGTGLGETVADQISTTFSVFNLDPSNPTSQNQWTAVGAGSENTGDNAGQVTSIAVDPSDPSGNTVYAAGASGGVWKTTDFLTTNPAGPTWIPLTDFGPTTSLNVGSIAVFPENNNPLDSVILVGTGQFGSGTFGSNGTAGTGEGDPQIDSGSSQTPGIGFLLSLDGGQTWQVLDSTSNYGTDGQILSINDPSRNHDFVGTSISKVLIDPTASASGQLIFYAAVSPSVNSSAPGASSGGVWRSSDTGKTWQLIEPGNATDIVLAAGSAGTGTGGTSKNLQILYAGLIGGPQGAGVYYTPTAPTATSNGGVGSMSRLTGGTQNPLFINISTSLNAPLLITNTVGVFPGSTAVGRIALATPALTNSPLLNENYEGWLYAYVIAAAGDTSTLYMSKDFGRNWTLVQMPQSNEPPLVPFGNGTNDYSNPAIQVVGGAGDQNTLITNGVDNMSIAIDPQNPNIVYLGGSNWSLTTLGVDSTTTGLVRVDTTKLQDTQALVAYNNSLPFSINPQDPLFDPIASTSDTTGNATIEPNPPAPFLGSGQPYGIVPTEFDSIEEPTVDIGYLNLFRDPNDPFKANATILISNVASLQNTGYGAVVEPITGIELSSNVHSIVSFVDPVTGETRLLIGDDQGISTVLDSGASSILGTGAGTDVSNVISYNPGFAENPSLARNGDLQIAQFYSGTAQPSQLAADVAGAMFYGMSLDNGFSASSPNILQTGNTDWTAAGGYTVATGYGNGVVTDQTGGGTAYEFRAPQTPGNDGTTQVYIPTDFVREITNTAANPAGSSVTNGLLQAGDAPQDLQGQWSEEYGSTLAINPLDPSALLVSASGTAVGGSGQGRVFLTTDPTDTWFEIGSGGANEPAPGQSGANLDGTYADALAFGAPSPSDQKAGQLSDFIYVGTAGGDVFVSGTGGAPWTNITAALGGAGALDGSPVMSISPDPRPGTTDVFAVTQQGVYYKADAFDTTSGWVNVTGNLFSLQNALYGDTNNPQLSLQFLTSLAVDWRYQIPVDPSNPTTSATFPIVYVGGDGGVYQSLNVLATDGPTWTYFPAGTTYTDSAGNTVSVPAGGYLPNVMVTNLSLSLGNINSASGLPDQSTGSDILLATTYGRGSFAINLGNQLPQDNTVFQSGPSVVSVINPNPASGPSSELEVKFSGPVDPSTFTIGTVQLLDTNNNPITITGVTEVPDLNGQGADLSDLFMITFTPQTVPGNYKLTVGYNANGSGVPTITDFSGNPMNQNGNVINGQPVVDQYIGLVSLNQSTNSHLTVTVSPTTTVAGVLNDITIVADDANDQMITTENGTITLTSVVNPPAGGEAGILSATTQLGTQTLTLSLVDGTTTIVSGNTSILAELALDTAGTNTVTASFTPSTGNQPLESALFTTVVIPANASQLIITPPSSVVSSPATVGFTITASDPYGNTDPNYDQTATLTTSGAAASLPGSVTLVSGVGSFSGSFGVSGTVYISATSPPVTSGGNSYGTLTTTTAATVLVNPGPAASLTVTATNPIQQGKPDTVTVKAFDAQGNLSALNGTFELSTTDQAAVITGTLVFVNGVGTGVITFNTVGTQTISANSGTLSASTSVTVSSNSTGGPNPGLSSTYAVGTGVNGSPTLTVYNGDGSVRFTVIPFPPGFLGEVAADSQGFTGGLRVAVGDVTGDGVADYVVGSGPGITASVVVFDGSTGQEILDYQPYGTFTGGVFVAVGDVQHLGYDDIGITPDQGGGPRVQILQGKTFTKIADFFALNNSAFRGGARIAIGDIAHDGYADVVVSAGFGGGPVISVYDGENLARGVVYNAVGDFFAFPDELRNGTYVAVGDVNGDGFGDIIIGAGPGGGPEVEIISGETLLTEGAVSALNKPLANFYAGNSTNRGGVRVAAKDLENTQYADLVTGVGEGDGSTVTAYSGSSIAAGDPTALYSFDALPGYTGGVYVG
jgi:subtilisin-like proprotein convertase family protein